MSSGLMGNSNVPQYVKLTATAILSTTYLAALIVATVDYLQYGPAVQLPSVVTFLLGTGVSMALGILGLHQGASLTESSPPPAPQKAAAQEATANASTATP